MRRSLLMLLAALGAPTVAAAQGADPIARLVARLDLEKYKATIKGLTQFGDRRQGTDRNRQAVEWIESQLKSYGCSDVSRIRYTYEPPPPRQPNATSAAPNAGRGGANRGQAQGGGRIRGNRARTGV